MDRHGPEISDVVIDYDPTTLVRRDVSALAALDRLRGTPGSAHAVLRRLPTRAGILDAHAVDGALIRSHLELQRLHEEFQIGASMRAVLAPLVALARPHVAGRALRIVDLGCGLGYVLRWLAARGELGHDVELIGADYNRTLVNAANMLAAREHLRCRFVAANAFELREPADIVISTGVLHHFRGDDLVHIFAEHARSPALAFVHLDIRPSWLASLGSWVFHRARMREPLAVFDGYWSAVRAHPIGTLCGAIQRGAPDFALATVDARLDLRALVRVMLGVIGVRGPLAPQLSDAYVSFGARIDHLANPRTGSP